MKLIKIRPSLSEEAIKKNNLKRKKNLLKKTFNEIEHDFNSALSKLGGLDFKSFFKPSKNTRSKHIEKILLLESFPYDHFERFGYLYKRELLAL